MIESIDDRLINIERAAQRESGYAAAASFCLYTVWNSEPTTVEGREAKERLLISIAPEREHGTYECPVEGCNQVSYPKNPDYRKDEDTVCPDGVYGPVSNDYCRFKDFCLKEAWEVGRGIESKPLRSAVVMGAYQYLTDECDQVSGASFPGGNWCVAPNCNLSAGFSEDGVGGTNGHCMRENQNPSVAEPEASA